MVVHGLDLRELTFLSILCIVFFFLFLFLSFFFFFLLLLLSCVEFFGTSGTVACQAPLSMGFSKKKYWKG